jgi:regulator of PEP synthase PpsR (kinase-PPPase family)
MALDATSAGQSADSYVTLSEYQARATAMGWTLADTDAANEINLRRAAVVLDSSYGWKGVRGSEFQARDWPRDNVGYVDGWWVDGDIVPQAIKDAQMEMAFLIQGGADPLATVTAPVRRERKRADVLETETEYAGGKALPRFTAVDRILRDYVRAGAGQIHLARA